MRFLTKKTEKHFDGQLNGFNGDQKVNSLEGKKLPEIILLFFVKNPKIYFWLYQFLISEMRNSRIDIFQASGGDTNFS